MTRIYCSWKRLWPRATYALNFVNSKQDFHIEFVKSVIGLKNSYISNKQARIISKREISVRNGKTGAVPSKREPPVQNGRVGTYVKILLDYYCDTQQKSPEEFAKFIGIQLCRSLFFNKVEDRLKKRLRHSAL